MVQRSVSLRRSLFAPAASSFAPAHKLPLLQVQGAAATSAASPRHPDHKYYLWFTMYACGFRPPVVVWNRVHRGVTCATQHKRLQVALKTNDDRV